MSVDTLGLTGLSVTVLVWWSLDPSQPAWQPSFQPLLGSIKEKVLPPVLHHWILLHYHCHHTHGLLSTGVPETCRCHSCGRPLPSPGILEVTHSEEVEGEALALSQGKGVLCVFFLCEFSYHFLIEMWSHIGHNENYYPAASCSFLENLLWQLQMEISSWDIPPCASHFYYNLIERQCIGVIVYSSRSELTNWVGCPSLM